MPIFYVPPPTPQPRPQLVQGGAPPAADDPPFARRRLAAISAILLLAWQPAAPAAQPFREYVVQGGAPPAADAPPPDRSRTFWTVRAAWDVVLRLPQRSRFAPIPPAVVVVDNPPFAARRLPRLLAAIRAAWEPGPPVFPALPPNKGKRPQGGTWVAPPDTTYDRYASYSLDALADAYQGRLLNSADLTITRELADPLWSPVPDQSVTLELDNTDGALTPWYLAGPRGRAITLTRYDVRSGLRLTKFTGIITWPRLAEQTVTLECAVLDRALFTEPIPAPVVTTLTFPQSVDVGATIPVVFGHVPTMPCPNVSDDRVHSLFDYLVGHGTLAVTALARNGLNDSLYSIQYSECVRADGTPATSWAEVARTDLYPGYTVVRFILRQQDFNNGLHRIYANVTGPAATRNYAHAISAVLSNPTWGLRQTVNADSVTAAAAILDALAVPLYCDGVMLAARPAQEWLSDLLMVRGMWLDRNAAGEIVLQIDQPRTTVAMAIGHDPGDGPRNLVGIRTRSGPAPEEYIRQLLLKYRLDYVRDEFIGQATRGVNAEGKTREIKHAFLRDAMSADLVADYLSKRVAIGQEPVELTVTQEGRALDVGDIVSLTKAGMGYDGNLLEVWKIAERLTTLTLTLRGWHWNTFAYTPSTLAVDPIAGTEDDYSRTVPTNPFTFAISAQGVTIAGDGRASAFVVFDLVNQSSNFKQTLVRYRLAGTATYVSGAISIVAGATTARIEGLLPATSYDYHAMTENNFGLFSTGLSILAQTTATDATVPTAPSAIAVSQSGGKVVEIRVTASVPSDWGTTRLYRATSNSFGAATEIQQGKKLSFHDESVAYATTYYYWAKIEDTSGNLSAVSPSSGHSVTVAQIVTADMGTAQVTTPIIAPNATTASASVSLTAQTSTTSTTAVDMASTTITLTTQGGPVLVTFTGYLLIENNSGGTDQYVGRYDLLRDGSELTHGFIMFQTLPPAYAIAGSQTLTYVDNPSAGSHTYKMTYFVANGASGTLYAGHRTLQAVEFKR